MGGGRFLRDRSGAALGCLLAVAGASASELSPSVPGPSQEPRTRLDWRATRTFSSADGLPQNSVLALLQDRDGFVYVGTNHGLARYDGHQWRGIDLPTEGRSYAVGALLQSRDGTLWIGTDAVGAWLVRGDDATQLALSGDPPTVNAFWEAPDGRVWVATFEGLHRCEATQCARVEALGHGGVRSLFGESDDATPRLWVGTNDEGVIELLDIDAPAPRRSGRRIDRSHGLPNNVGLAITRFAGDLWIGSGRGLVRFDGERLHVFDAGNGFPPAMVFALLPDVDASGAPVLYAALRPGGLAELRADGRWRLLDSRDGLAASAVHSLMRDRLRGNLWVGSMNAGIARIERERWTLLDERAGLPDRNVIGLGWSAPARRLWVGTGSGAVQWRDGAFEALLPAPHDALLVYDLLDAPDGTRWIAHARGLQRWRGESLVRAYSPDDSALPAVAADRLAWRRSRTGDELYAGTGHGLARWHDGELTRVDPPGFEPRGTIRALAIVADPSGAEDVLWVASSDHLARRDAQGWQAIALDCLAQRALYGLAAARAPDGRETLWIASRGGLLRRAADGACELYPASQQLGALTRVELGAETIWIFGARGAMRLARDGPLDQPGRSYGVDAGLVSPEIADAAIDDEGRVFAATAAGLAALQPLASAPRTTAAPLHLLAARYGARLQQLDADALLPPDDSSVQFEVGLLALEREHARRYRFRLAGLESDFGPWTPRGDVQYARLPPGRYRLQVEALDADGVAATPLQFAFGVDTPWWQRAWARIAAALALLALGLGLGRWRLRAARRRAEQLEADVAQRTRELADANALLEQAAVTDPLTGLRNRRYFALAAEAEAERARRAAANLCLLVVLLDVDHFKRINDEHGHASGDRVLAEVAQRLQRVARGGDFVLRWGGEEFLLLMRDVERSHAGELLHRILVELAQQPVRVDGVAMPVTASIGAIRFPAENAGAEPATLEQAIARADAVLYRAKREGRDRALLVEAAGQGEPPCRAILRGH
jgi:diguanylate cyclase (GGDEF)-like protein